MYRIRKALATLAIALAAGGTCFQVGGCDLLGLAAGGISRINPCTTFLACDPRAYQLLNSGIDGPGVRPAIDPFCTFPPFCGQAQDPIFGGIGGP